MPRHIRLSLIAALCILGTLPLARVAAGQSTDVLTVVEPADDLLLPDSAAETHVTLQVDTAAAGLPPDAGITLSSTIGGQAATRARFAEVRPDSGVYQMRFPVAPCSLPAASDLPGVEIGAEFQARIYDRPLQADGSPMPGATLLGGELLNRAFTLAPDTRPPLIEPRPGPETRVRPGQTLEVSALGTDRNEPGSWATGIQKIAILGLDGASLGEAQDPKGEPKPCAEKNNQLEGFLNYTVPADARDGDVIALTAVVTDWANNERRATFRLVVSNREEWDATFTFRIDALDPGTDTVMFGEVVEGQFTFTLDCSLDPSGMFAAIEGTGRARRTTHGGRSDDCTVAYSRPPEEIRIEVKGAVFGGNLLPVIVDPTPSTATITTSCPGGTESGTVPWAGTEAVHPFGISMPFSDGARFTMDEPFGGLRIQATLTIRRRT